MGLAGEIGLDPEDAREALLSHRYAARVADEGREAARLGATGVPFFVIDRRYGVAGAQPAGTLLAALERAWDERPGAGPPRTGRRGAGSSWSRPAVPYPLPLAGQDQDGCPHARARRGDVPCPSPGATPRRARAG